MSEGLINHVAALELQDEGDRGTRGVLCMEVTKFCSVLFSVKSLCQN